MQTIETNTRPTTTGPILNPKFNGSSAAAQLNAVITASLALAEEQVGECYAGVRQLDHITFKRVIGFFPEGEAWRYCASPALIELVEGLRALTRDIPEARRVQPPSLDAEVITPTSTHALTDEVQLANGAKGNPS